jgi:hypothetical protein
MVLGIISIPVGVLAIVIGNMALTDARRMGDVNTGQAKAGIWCGIAGIVLAIGIIVVAVATSSS